MNKNDGRFIGRPEEFSFNSTEAQKREAKKRQEQFEADLLKELGDNTNPTDEEEFEAGQRVLDRWFPKEAALNAVRKKKEEQFEAEILQELGNNTNPTEEEREAARRRVIDRWYPDVAARYKARLAQEETERQVRG